MEFIFPRPFHQQCTCMCVERRVAECSPRVVGNEKGERGVMGKIKNKNLIIARLN